MFEASAANGRQHLSIRHLLACCVGVGAIATASMAFADTAGQAAGQNPTSPSTSTPAPVTKQPASADSNLIQEIVVTANRRAETVQKSSLAVSAFNTATLRAVGLAQAGDLNKLVQGLQIGATGSTTQVYIRGVGDFSGNPLSNPGVAFNVDGVYVGRPEAIGVNFYDIARMEVVKGPQGTLYGRNASGGAINLLTNSPTFDGVSGVFNTEVGNYSEFHLDGAVNIPVSDTVAIRAAVNRIKRDGYLSDGSSDDDQLAGRLKVLLKPSDDVSLLVSTDFARVRGVGGGYVTLPGRPGSNAWEGAGSPEAVAYEQTFNPQILKDANGNTIDTRNAYVRNNFWNMSAQLDVNLGFANLTLIPAYRHTETDTLSYNDQKQQLSGSSSQETFEARLSHASAKLKWVAGLFFFHEYNPGEIQIFVGKGLLQSQIFYRPKGTSYAAFGEATYSITDHFRLIVGGRYTTEKRELDGDFFVSPNQDNNFLLYENFGGQKTFNSGTWKAGSEFDLTPRSLLFATASTGFKAGGITQTVPPDNIYKPEKVLAFELGSRNRFFNNKLQINLEAFHWTYTDQQLSHLTFDTLGNVNFLTQNAGKAKIYGLNVDVIARPTVADTFHVAGEYDHSKYSSLVYQVPIFAYSPVATGCSLAGVSPGPFVPLANIDCTGNQLPHAPKWSGVADYTHSFALASGGSVDVSGNIRLQSQTWLAIDYIPEEHAPSFTMLGANLAYRSRGDRWSISAFVRNITNAREYTGGQEQTQAPPIFSANISAPRTYGAQGHLTF